MAGGGTGVCLDWLVGRLFLLEEAGCAWCGADAETDCAVDNPCDCCGCTEVDGNATVGAGCATFSLDCA